MAWRPARCRPLRGSAMPRAAGARTGWGRGIWLCDEAVPPGQVLTVFFFNDPAPPEIYTLSLHDALPISTSLGREPVPVRAAPVPVVQRERTASRDRCRSEERFSRNAETDLVCRLPL